MRGRRERIAKLEEMARLLRVGREPEPDADAPLTDAAQAIIMRETVRGVMHRWTLARSHSRGQRRPDFPAREELRHVDQSSLPAEYEDARTGFYIDRVSSAFIADAREWELFELLQTGCRRLAAATGQPARLG